MDDANDALQLINNTSWKVYQDALAPPPTRRIIKAYERVPVVARATRLHGQRIWKKPSLRSQLGSKDSSDENAFVELERDGVGARKKQRVMGLKEDISNAQWQERNSNQDDQVIGALMSMDTNSNVAEISEDALQFVPRKRTNTNHVITPRKPPRRQARNDQLQAKPVDDIAQSPAPSKKRKSFMNSPQKSEITCSEEPQLNAQYIGTAIEVIGRCEFTTNHQNTIPPEQPTHTEILKTEDLESVCRTEVDTTILEKASMPLAQATMHISSPTKPQPEMASRRRSLRRSTRRSTRSRQSNAKNDEPSDLNLESSETINNVVTPLKTPHGFSMTKVEDLTQESAISPKYLASSSEEFNSKKRTDTNSPQAEKSSVGSGLGSENPNPENASSGVINTSPSATDIEEVAGDIILESAIDTHQAQPLLDIESTESSQPHATLQQVDTTVQSLPDHEVEKQQPIEVVNLPMMDSPEQSPSLEMLTVGSAEMQLLDSVSSPSSEAEMEFDPSQFDISPNQEDFEDGEGFHSVETLGLEDEGEVATATLETEAEMEKEPILSTVSSQQARVESSAPSIEIPTKAYDHDDDTDMLRNFLTRVKANKAAKAGSVPQRKRSLPHSPLRLPLDSTGPVSPLPSEEKDEFDVSNTPRRVESNNNTQSSDDANEPRRSSRKKLPAKSVSIPGVPSLIPVRRLLGQEDTTLTIKKSDDRELATLTRFNTRKNKGSAKLASIVLAKKMINQDDPSARQRHLKETFEEKTRREKGGKTRKRVTWAEELARFQDDKAPESKTEDDLEKNTSGNSEKKNKAAYVRVSLRSESRSLPSGIPVNGTPAPKKKRAQA